MTAMVIWDAVARRTRKKIRREEIPALMKFLERCDNAHAKTLAGRPGRHDCSPASAIALEEIVLELYRDSKLNKAQMGDWLVLIYAAISEARKQDSSIAETHLPDVPAVQTSPFSRDAMPAARAAAVWRDALHRWIAKQEILTDRPTTQAALCLSAVLNGGLLDPVKLEQFLKHLGKGVTPEVFNGYATYEFNMPFQGLGNHHLQRWLLDPITEMLLWRMPRSAENLAPGQLLKRLLSLLRDEGIPESLCPKTLRQFSDAAAAWWATRASQIDIQGISRKFATHSIHPQSWQRFVNTGKESDAANSVAQSGRRRRKPVDVAPEDDDVDPTLLYPWINDLDAILSTTNKMLAFESVERLMLSLEPTTQPGACSYLGWVRWLLDGKSSSHKALSLTTIARRVRATLPALLTLLGDEDPATLDTSELQDHYSDLTGEATSSASTLDLAFGLRDFHAYLVKDHGKEVISREREAFGDDGALKPVDANLPSFDDYGAAQAWLDSQLTMGWTRDDITICKLAMMFAFRAGLRRMEIFGLRIADLHDHRQLHVLVRKNDLRRIKTRNSQRIVPLYAFLDWKERRLLKGWLARRREEIANSTDAALKNEFLFPAFADGKRLTWVDGMTDRICRAIRQVTGHDGLFLHHFRHAFGTWTYLRLRAPDYPLIPGWFDDLPLTHKHLASGSRLRFLLFRQHDGASRSYAFAVARLLGHSSPAVSLAHYVHSADLILGAVAWRGVSLLPQKLLIAASGLSRSIAYQLHKQGVSALVSGCRHYFSDRHPGERQRTRNRVGTIPVPVPPKNEITLETCYGLVTAAVKANATPREIAQLVGLDEHVICDFLASAVECGPRIGLEVVAGRLKSIPARPKGDNERQTAQTLFRELQEAAVRDSALFKEGLEIHLGQFDRTKKDVLFHGVKEAGKLKIYLRFLHMINADPAGYRWVLRRLASDPRKLPAWCKRVSTIWHPAEIRTINPPSDDKAASVADWVGIQSFDPVTSRASGSLTTAVMYFAMISPALLSHADE